MIFSKFFQNEYDGKRYGQLFEIFKKEYSNESDESLLKASCIAGLFARVAYVDFELDENEVIKMRDLLSKWDGLESFNLDLIVKMSTEHIKEMAGLENHLYVHPLKELLSESERFQVLQSLFFIAASDGVVQGEESEEIRLISKGLALSNQHFIAARAQVVEFIAALKS